MLKPNNSLWEAFKTKVYKTYSRRPGVIITHAGAIGWIGSSIAQVCAIIFNDKISSDQKKFLIPQEIADGFINVASFYLITSYFTKVPGKLVKTGKWSSKAIRDFVEKHPLPEGKKMGDLKTDLTKIYENNKEFYHIYDPFKGGMEMIASTIGSVLSCNLLTPVLRNIFASKQQKASLEKERLQNQALIPTSPILPAQNKVTTTNYQNPMAKIPPTNPNHSMKI